MKKLLLSVSLGILGFAFPLRAQEMLGTTLGNWAGINSVHLNPSAMLGSKQYLDIQLTGMDLFFQNNYLYLDKSEFVLWDIFKPGFVLPSHDEDYGIEVRNFYRYDNNRRKDVFLNLRVNGPGAMVIWKKHAFGLHTAFRSVSSVTNLPVDLANFLYLGLNYKPQHDINYQTDKRFGLAQMTWLEAGVSYAYQVHARQFNRLDAGLSVRKLFGISGLWAVVDQIDYMVPDDSTLQINNLDAEYGLSLPVNYNSNPLTTSTNPLIAGGGWGVDLGVTYTRLRRPYQPDYSERLCAQKYDDYLYRIGVSLIDLGGITFRERAATYAIENQSSYWENLTSFDFQTVAQLMDTISYQFYGDPDASYRNDRFTMWLPSALSIQADYHHYRNWYISGTLVFPFQVSKISVYRPALLAITPRYEARWFEASLPVSLYHWYQLRLGLSLRFYILTIGTEKLGPFFGLGNFNGMDLYFSIKIPFAKGFCRKKSSETCPAYNTFKRLKL